MPQKQLSRPSRRTRRWRGQAERNVCLSDINKIRIFGFFNHCYDKDGSFFESFTLSKAGVTRNIVIDQTGKISFLTRLFDKIEFAQMIEHIDQLLK